ncbi:hypothetical protein JTB14_021215 [Gonioctena quinquepunctata]|nr:hypothetical protein JTB14_021215 [Gonioctena quinquepunctata]
MVYVNRLKRCHRRPKRPISLNGGSQQVRGKADDRTTRVFTSRGPTSSSHSRKTTAPTEPPEDFGGPITGTQETTGTQIRLTAYQAAMS